MEIWGYLGLFFASIYRIPQMIKIYRTKKGEDVSKKSFIMHNCAYISFIFYLTIEKVELDYVLFIYYLIGMSQNLIIIGMKKHYKKSTLHTEKGGELSLNLQV